MRTETAVEPQEFAAFVCVGVCARARVCARACVVCGAMCALW